MRSKFEYLVNNLMDLLSVLEKKVFRIQGLVFQGLALQIDQRDEEFLFILHNLFYFLIPHCKFERRDYRQNT